MKKVLAFTCFVALLSFSAQSHGKNVQGPYIGIGGSYAIENFDLDSIDFDGSRFNPDFDNTWGLNAKIGYQVIDWFALEFNFDYLSDFEADDKVVVEGVPVKGEIEVDVMTFMVAAKFAAGMDAIRPFLVVGAGVMNADADVKARAPGVSESDSDSETDSCASLGLGVDFFASDNVSLGFEGSHVWGFGDLDEVRYYKLTVGVAYHF